MVVVGVLGVMEVDVVEVNGFLGKDGREVGDGEELVENIVLGIEIGEVGEKIKNVG